MKPFLSVLFCVCLAGCMTTQQQADEQVRQGVYAVNDSMKAGRFDLANNYSNGLVKTVPPPKHRIPIKSIYKDEAP